MTKTFKTWLMLLALVGLGACASLRQQVETPKVSLADINVLAFGLIEQSYMLTFRVQNPNAFDIPVEGLTYTLSFNEQKFAEGVASPQATIPKYGEALIQTEAVSNLGGLLKQLQSLETGEGLHYDLTGKIDVGGLRGLVPFEHTGEILLPMPPK